jgi:processive 1,2-diacylglycerol beta-glucosyltransferase
VSGIPIDPAFAVAKDKVEMRRKLGLATDRTTVLLSAGGFGVGPIEHALTNLSTSPTPRRSSSCAGGMRS